MDMNIRKSNYELWLISLAWPYSGTKCVPHVWVAVFYADDGCTSSMCVCMDWTWNCLTHSDKLTDCHDYYSKLVAYKVDSPRMLQEPFHWCRSICQLESYFVKRFVCICEHIPIILRDGERKTWMHNYYAEEMYSKTLEQQIHSDELDIIVFSNLLQQLDTASG